MGEVLEGELGERRPLHVEDSHGVQRDVDAARLRRHGVGVLRRRPARRARRPRPTLPRRPPRRSPSPPLSSFAQSCARRGRRRRRPRGRTHARPRRRSRHRRRRSPRSCLQAACSVSFVGLLLVVTPPVAQVLRHGDRRHQPGVWFGSERPRGKRNHPCPHGQLVIWLGIGRWARAQLCRRFGQRKREYPRRLELLTARPAHIGPAPWHQPLHERLERSQPLGLGLHDPRRARARPRSGN